MYGKLFDTMYDSTLAEDWRALITFQQMIILCDADGMVDMTPNSLSRRTGIPIEHIKAGITILEAPDPYSRTPDEDGKRIELIDEHRPWGWHIVNHEKYKNLQDSDTVRRQTRERVRKHREKKKNSVTVTDGNAQKRHTDTDTDINIKKRVKKAFSPPEFSEVEIYARDRGYQHLARKFFDYFHAGDWVDSNGNKVKSWKQKFISWEGRDNAPKESTYNGNEI